MFSEYLSWFWLTAMIEIALLACVFYYTFRFLQGTRSAQVLSGLVLALLVMFAATHFMHLDVINWILRQLLVYLVIGFLIIFQPEIRRALAEFGRPRMFFGSDVKRNVVDQITQAVAFLAERRIGALIGIEREIGTRAVQETGVKQDSRVEWGLLAGIFFPHTPLHDGGVIVREDRVVAASCLFPLSQRSELGRTLGTRHRAAIGLTEETDAVVVVVSEETGAISVSFRGRLIRDMDSDRLRRFLSKVLMKGRQTKTKWDRVKEQLDLSPTGIARSEDLAKQEGPDEE